MSRLRSTLAIGLVTLACLACDPGVRLGRPCERSSECDAPLACGLGRCREECLSSADCPLEGECVGAGELGVCRLPSDTCADDSQCPAPLLCGTDGVCRAACVGDAQCAEGSRCGLAGERLLCARETTVPDGGADAGPRDGGSDGGAGACSGGAGADFANGLEGWCFEGSTGLDLEARRSVVAAGHDGRALELDLGDAAPGDWIRAFQEIPFDEGVSHTATFAAIEIRSGAVVIALEALDADGALLARAAVAQGSADVPEPCRATGREGACLTHGVSSDIAIGTSSMLARTDVDMRRIDRLRRVVELVAGPLVGTRVTIDGIHTSEPFCAIAWWRGESRGLLAESLDRPVTALDPSLAWAGAALRGFPVSACGPAVGLYGDQWLERAAPLGLAEGPLTIELWWHPPLEALAPPGSNRSLIHQRDGDLEVHVAGGRMRARMGTCLGGTPALEVIDPTPLGEPDRRFQQLEVVADWPGERLCLHREGHLVGCATSPACPLGMPGSGGLRIGAGEAPESAWIGAIDELRIRRGDLGPRDASARTGRCHVDRVCSDHSRIEVRDSGSGECVAATSCVAITTCPEGARDPALSCTSAALGPCVLAMECPSATAACTGGCRIGSQCDDLVAADPSGCP